jgi:hypothetical protein
VTYKFSLLTSSSIFIIILSNNVWSSNIQIDSTLKTIDVSTELSEKYFHLNYNDLFYPSINRCNFYNSSDSLALLLNMDLLNQRLNSNYIFQSSLSEQWRINEELTSYIKFNNDLSLKSDLGVFGKVLGNSKIMTALILAVLHVIKYKKGLY